MSDKVKQLAEKLALKHFYFYNVSAIEAELRKLLAAELQGRARQNGDRIGAK